MKYQILFSLKSNEKVFIRVSAVVVGALKVKMVDSLSSETTLPFSLLFAI